MEQFDQAESMISHDAEMVIRDLWRDEIETRTTDPLVAMRAAQAMIEYLQGQIAFEVGAARREGHSWTRVGAQLGMSKQGASKRYAS